MPKVFKVWSPDRLHRKSVLLRDNTDLYHNFLMIANNKLNIDGQKVVLESNGTEVDEDDILDYFNTKGEVFILLQEGESWQPPHGDSTNASDLPVDALPLQMIPVVKSNEQVKSASRTKPYKELSNVSDVSSLTVSIRKVLETQIQVPKSADREEAKENEKEPNVTDALRMLNEEVVHEEHVAAKSMQTTFQFNWNTCNKSYRQELERGTKNPVVRRYISSMSTFLK